MKKLILIFALIGCNEPIKHETKTYTGDSDWLRINKLVTDFEKNDFERCIKDKNPELCANSVKILKNTQVI